MFALFRGLTYFLDLPLPHKLVRVLFFPFFLLRFAFSTAFAKAPPPVASPFKTLHELPPAEAVDPVTQARAPFAFADLAGRPVLVVNVASACGLTAQNYKELAEMYEPLKARKGLEVLSFPCDQFMHQEPGDTAATCSFAAKKGAKWPVFDKVDVNGPNASPVYNFLKASSRDGQDVRWNFEKFVVGRDGVVVKRYAPGVPPSAIAKDVEAL